VALNQPSEAVTAPSDTRLGEKAADCSTADLNCMAKKHHRCPVAPGRSSCRKKLSSLRPAGQQVVDHRVRFVADDLSGVQIEIEQVVECGRFLKKGRLVGVNPLQIEMLSTLTTGDLAHRLAVQFHTFLQILDYYACHCQSPVYAGCAQYDYRHHAGQFYTDPEYRLEFQPKRLIFQ
jgi:hypothetical protein